MTDTDEIDRRRAEVLFRESNPEITWAWRAVGEGTQKAFLARARAIRESDEASGYELVRKIEHKGRIG